MTELTCADRRLCVQKERVGDEYNDCGDGLDESDCGQYECQYWQAKCVSTGIHKGLWSVMLYGTMKMVLMRTPVEIKAQY